MGRFRLAPLLVVAVGAVAVSTLGSPVPSATPQPTARGAPAAFYGVGLAATPTRTDLERLVASGARTARLTIDWRAVQPFAGAPPSFAEIDPTIRALAAYRVQIVPQLISTPGWLEPDSVIPPVQSDEELAKWQAFVAAAVRRYGRGGQFWSENPGVPYDPVKSWQIWNEQNSPDFWQPAPSPAEYANLLDVSASTLRAVDPKARIVLGGMFETTGLRGAIFPWDYLRGLYAAGAERNFDAVGVHPYWPELSGVTFQLRKVREVITGEHDTGTPIWVDEIGWGSATTGSKLNVGPQGQARKLRGAFAAIWRDRKRFNIKRLIWVPLRDGGSVAACAFCSTEGLLGSDGTAKPAYGAFQHFAETHP